MAKRPTGKRPARRTPVRNGPDPRRKGDRHVGRPAERSDRPSKGLQMFAMTMPGMASFVSRELRSTLDFESADSGFDGRSDVVLFDVPRGSRRHGVLDLRTAEDVFVVVGSTQRSDGDKAHAIASRVWQPGGVQKALSVWAEHVRPLSGSMTYRVVVRVLQEKSFLRTELRKQFTRVIGDERPKWKVDDPAQIEIWVIEYAPGKIVAGLRLSTAAMRQHDGRAAERTGALRPAVASAMVQLAGEPTGALLDPCCGSGTILHEAQVEGWQPQGVDIDADAVDIAKQNVPDAVVNLGDARRLDLPDASVGACVSNLPFGEQYKIPGDPGDWLAAVLTEMTRVTRPGGAVVVLCPSIPRRSVPPELTLGQRTALTLLGMRTTIWQYRRA